MELSRMTCETDFSVEHSWMTRCDPVFSTVLEPNERLHWYAQQQANTTHVWDVPKGKSVVQKMWCLDDRGRDRWDWVGPSTWERALLNSPELGAISSPV